MSGDWQEDFSNTKKIVARILSKRLESKIEKVIEGQFGFWKGKDARDVFGLMRIISESVHDVTE